MAKYAARNTVFARATASNFTTVATINNVKSIDPGLGSERQAFDQSAFGDDWVDEGSGQRDGDTITLKLAYDPADATHVLLKSDYDTPAANVWLQASNATADWEWQATTVPRGWRPIFDRQGNIEVDILLKIVQPGVVEQAIS